MAGWLPPELTAWAKSITFFDGILWLLIGVGVLLFVRRGWPWLKDFAENLVLFVQVVDSLKGLPAFMKRTDESIASIYHETHKNDGSSIKDSQDRTEKRVNEVFDITAALVLKDAELEAAIEEHTIPKHHLPEEKP